jgi:hypothetical protein
LILLILVGLWIVVLAPSAIKRLFDRRPTASIESFHQRLDLLQRTGPKIVSPAYRLQTAHSGTGLAPCESGFPAVSSMPGRPNLVLLPPVDDEAVPEIVASFGPEGYEEEWVESYEEYPPVAAEARRRGPDPFQRHRTRVRRRNVLALLAVNLLVTAPLGAMAGLHLLWIVTGISGLALAAYLSLVAYAKALTAQERRFGSLERAGSSTSADSLDVYGDDEQPVLSRGIAVRYQFDDFEMDSLPVVIAR